GVHYRLFSVWTLVPVRLDQQLSDHSTVDEIASGQRTVALHTQWRIVLKGGKMTTVGRRGSAVGACVGHLLVCEETGLEKTGEKKRRKRKKEEENEKKKGKIARKRLGLVVLGSREENPRVLFGDADQESETRMRKIALRTGRRQVVDVWTLVPVRLDQQLSDHSNVDEIASGQRTVALHTQWRIVLKGGKMTTVGRRGSAVGACVGHLLVCEETGLEKPGEKKRRKRKKEEENEKKRKRARKRRGLVVLGSREENPRVLFGDADQESETRMRKNALRTARRQAVEWATSKRGYHTG
ncbi:hypothetical protein TNCV_4213411, partial [Trichonephila clavipes]